MATSAPPETTFAPTPGAAPVDAAALERRLAERFERLNEMFIQPAVAELQKVYAYCVEEAETDEIPLVGMNPYDFGPDVAFARRETQIANDLQAFVTNINDEFAALRARATQPLPTVSRQEQFAAMLAQAREADFGDRREFRFSPENAVTIDVAMVQEASGFYAPLIRAFMEEWEREIDAVWRAARDAGRPAPDPATLPPVRLAMQPSFLFFTGLPTLPLNRTDALTLVTIGMVLGQLECYPAPGDPAPDNTPSSDLPIVIACPPLLDAAAAARAAHRVA